MLAFIEKLIENVYLILCIDAVNIAYSSIPFYRC